MNHLKKSLTARKSMYLTVVETGLTRKENYEIRLELKSCRKLEQTDDYEINILEIATRDY